MFFVPLHSVGGVASGKRPVPFRRQPTIVGGRSSGSGELAEGEGNGDGFGVTAERGGSFVDVVFAAGPASPAMA